MRQIKPRYFYINITHYLWPLIVVGFWTFVILRRDIEISIKSKSTIPGFINRSKTPTFIVHINDLHLTDMHVSYVAGVWDLFNSIEKIINPSATLVAGDMTDSRFDEGKFSVYGQYEKSWYPYLQILKDHPNMTVYEAAGNHDEISIDSINHPDHMYVRYIKKNNASKFFIDTKYVETEDGKVKIVIFNPYKFPSPPLPLYVFADPTSHMLDLLEDSLKKEENVIFNIVVSHYPMKSTYNNINSQGHRLSDIISEQNNVRYYVVGHFHLANGFCHRLNNTLEVIGISPEVETHKVAVISVDNNVTVESIINFDDDYQFVVTNPPPMSQFSSLNNYVTEEFRIRVGVFSQDNVSIIAYLDGKRIGNLEVDVATDSFVTWGIDAHAEKGRHTLRLEGDVRTVLTFIVGQTYPEAIAFGISYYLHLKAIVACIIFVNALIILLLTLPKVFDMFFASYFHAYGAWLYGDQQLHTYAIANFIRAIFVGPLYCMWRYNFVSRKTKRSLLFMYVSNFFTPFYFYRSARGIMTVWFWGYTTSSQLEIDTYCWICQGVYILTCIYPLWFLAGLYTESQRWSKQLSIDFFIWTIPLIVSFWIIISLISMGGGVFSIFTSPTPVKFFVMTILIMRDIFGEKSIISQIIDTMRKKED